MKRALVTIIAMGMAVCTFPISSWAAHGTQQTGFGPIQEAMSGANTAAPLDAHVVAINPAGISEALNRVDMAVALGYPVASMNTSAAPAGNAAAGNQGNEREIFPLPAISATWGLMDDRLALGFGFVQNGGLTASYKQSRINSALTGNLYDTYIDYRMFKMIPAVAYRIMDNLSVGASFQLGYGTFGTDSAIPSTLMPTSGRSRNDNAFGFAGSIGVLYTPIDQLTIGFSYQSKMKFMKFKKYADVLANNSLDAPRQIRLGITGRPIRPLILTTEFHWINWSDVSVLGDMPGQGGLGWKDQYIAKFGVQYWPIKRLKLRVGYNWQSELVSSEVVFANALVPLVTEHTVNAGIGVDITKRWVVDLAFGWALKNSKTQSATTNPVGAAGTGTRVEYAGYAGVLGLTYKWDR